MNENPGKRRCSAVCRNGRPCRAWAVIGSDPALCSAHAGRNAGAGAPAGNQNRLKHGLYASTIKLEKIEDPELLAQKGVAQEMALLRVILLRLSRFLGNEALPLQDIVSIVPPAVTLVRAIAHLQRQMEDVSIDWDRILDELNEQWEIEV